MEKYLVKFQKDNKIHKVTVSSNALIPAIEEAVRKHFTNHMDALGYEIISAERITR